MRKLSHCLAAVHTCKLFNWSSFHKWFNFIVSKANLILYAHFKLLVKEVHFFAFCLQQISTKRVFPPCFPLEQSQGVLFGKCTCCLSKCKAQADRMNTALLIFKSASFFLFLFFFLYIFSKEMYFWYSDINRATLGMMLKWTRWQSAPLLYQVLR